MFKWTGGVFGLLGIALFACLLLGNPITPDPGDAPTMSRPLAPRQGGMVPTVANDGPGVS